MQPVNLNFGARQYICLVCHLPFVWISNHSVIRQLCSDVTWLLGVQSRLRRMLKSRKMLNCCPETKTNKAQTLMCTQKCDMLYGKILDYIIRKSNAATIIGIWVSDQNVQPKCLHLLITAHPVLIKTFETVFNFHTNHKIFTEMFYIGSRR